MQPRPAFNIDKKANSMDFRALQVDNGDSGYRADIKTLPISVLGEGGVLVKIAYSSLNYKDALAVTGKGKIIRQFPLIPGIDFAGEVLESDSVAFVPGQQVILTGWGVGERVNGGLAEYARVKPEWLVPLPAGLDVHQAMAVGTAGLTAMLCVMALEQHGVAPDSGEVLVSGASGGVGSIALALLANLGYRVVAVSGKPELTPWLIELGASSVLLRESIAAAARPLESEQYSGAIDTCGSSVLAGLLPRIRYGGCVAACGLAAGFDLNTTVMPFILRGVSLAGVDSVMCPLPRRNEAWQRIARDLPLSLLARLSRDVDLARVEDECQRMAAGGARGRVVVRMEA
ncbi:MAG: acrylyl-CoA reductase [Pseudomonadota bacterium]|jgi:acrylyl-CoA reductase (NADPH)|nr:acrylyl-CoA reductase [Pseudomonadota bacterium]